jgi:undecaprenyl-diphosphatase
MAVLGWAVGAGPLPLDRSIADALVAAWPGVLTDAFDTLASLPVVIAIGVAAAVASIATRRPAMATAIVLGLFGEIPTTIVKAIVDRPRPPGGSEVEAIGSVASYPSGHTVRAVVLAGLFVAAFAWRNRGRGTRTWAVLVAVVVIVLVGIARVASGEHWPTDVVGGLLLGGAWLVLCLLVGDRDRRSEGRVPGA